MRLRIILRLWIEWPINLERINNQITIAPPWVLGCRILKIVQKMGAQPMPALWHVPFDFIAAAHADRVDVKHLQLLPIDSQLHLRRLFAGRLARRNYAQRVSSRAAKVEI